MEMQKPVFLHITVLFILLTLTSGCSRNTPPGSAVPAGKARIYPDYTDIIIPVNIAPLNFRILEPAEKYLIHLHAGEDDGFLVSSGNGKMKIPQRKWRSLLRKCTGGQMKTDVYVLKNGKWLLYESIINRVVPDSVDSHLAYRLIEPGFETWNEMGIYQRNLENFHEEPVMINELSDGNCMNCHAFAGHDPETMMFHTRAQHSGTVILRKGVITKVDTKTDSTISAGVYPSWHPGGRYIAFSVNRIVQSFHAIPGRKIEVIDTLSDLVLYDSENNCIIKDTDLSVPDRYETFPSWSPDGRYLYYCSAPFRHYQEYDQIRYDLLRTSFDQATGDFSRTDTVLPAGRLGYSISFPRISPDGKYLLYCKTAYGSFTIWHHDADLELFDLDSGQIRPVNLNSNRTESYHTWSSSGKWVVFSSRREDGLYTRLYFSYFDKNGTFSKPFLLPQKDPDFNAELLKSYNVPELITRKIQPGPRVFARMVKSEATPSTFKKQ